MQIDLSPNRLVLRHKVYTGETISLVVFLIAACVGFYCFYAQWGDPVSPWIMIVPISFGYFAIGMREDLEFEFDRAICQIRWRRFQYFIPKSGTFSFSEITAIQQFEGTSDGGPEKIYYVELLRSDNTGVTIKRTGLGLEEAQAIVKAISEVLPKAGIQSDNVRRLKTVSTFGMPGMGESK